MITAGVDLSSQDKGTALCEVEWSSSGAQVTDLRVGSSDGEIVKRISKVDKLGIDVPLGWPSYFVDALAQHALDGSWPSDYRHSDTTAVRFRRTDLMIRASIPGHTPLSVSTDRIALPAMRAAALLSNLPDRVALDGSGVIVEVYPAVALRRWGFRSQGYKGPDKASIRMELVALFARATSGWLEIPDNCMSLLRSSADAFDALIASLVARASAKGLVEPIEDSDRPAALKEGWIALPREGSLPQLAL